MECHCYNNDPFDATMTRRTFLTRTSAGLGSAALANLLLPTSWATQAQARVGGLGTIPHFTPKAKRVIYLFMSGGPSHLDLYDYKPKLNEMHGQELPASVRGNERLTLMTRNQSHHLIAGSRYKFAKHGESGQEFSELLPNIAKIADDIAIIRSMHTEPINHDPAVTFVQTGGQLAGRPCMGSWLSYGLGNENENLPAFVVLLSVGRVEQPALSRYWHNGFLPSEHQGVQFQSQGDPVLFLTNPGGIDHEMRGEMIKGINDLNRLRYNDVGDAEILARIRQFELAYRMQTSVPELMDIKSEPESMLKMYGAEPGKASFANNCLLARRLAERGVRFIQLYHRGWDHHLELRKNLPEQCRQTDQASAALIQDLKQRRMLDDTLVIWGGEFGRTSYCQGELNDLHGRDHHPGCFTLWMAGGGIKGGFTLGKTDDFAYNIAEDPIHVHDFQATVLHQMGIDHERLTYKFKGRDFRLTDVAGKVIKPILA